MTVTVLPVIVASVLQIQLHGGVNVRKDLKAKTAPFLRNLVITILVEEMVFAVILVKIFAVNVIHSGKVSI